MEALQIKGTRTYLHLQLYSDESYSVCFLTNTTTQDQKLQWLQHWGLDAAACGRTNSSMQGSIQARTNREVFSRRVAMSMTAAATNHKTIKTINTRLTTFTSGASSSFDAFAGIILTTIISIMAISMMFVITTATTNVGLAVVIFVALSMVSGICHTLNRKVLPTCPSAPASPVLGPQLDSFEFRTLQCQKKTI